ncbi:MAG: ATP-binding protein [Bacteroidales bacterium]|jgi:thymidylate kinase|nr:ATP-binding protein [Bacteroidales bacterium]
MRIAVTGSHCVGKTTIVEELQKLLPDYEFYSEPYYELEERGHLFSETPTIDDYIEQFEYSIKQISASGNNAIFDRCPIDLFAYIQGVGGLRDIQAFYQMLEAVMPEIDLLVFVPIEEPDRIPCSELPELRQEVNEILLELIEELGIETIEVHGGISQRLNQIRGKI